MLENYCAVFAVCFLVLLQEIISADLKYFNAQVLFKFQAAKNQKQNLKYV